MSLMHLRTHKEHEEHKEIQAPFIDGAFDELRSFHIAHVVRHAVPAAMARNRALFRAVCRFRTAGVGSGSLTNAGLSVRSGRNCFNSFRMIAATSLPALGLGARFRRGRR